MSLIDDDDLQDVIMDIESMEPTKLPHDLLMQIQHVQDIIDQKTQDIMDKSVLAGILTGNNDLSPILPSPFSYLEQEHIEKAKRGLLSLLEQSRVYQLLLNHQFQDSMFITGGAIASLLQKEEINDIDIYFRDGYSMNRAKDLLMKNHLLIKDIDDSYSNMVTQIPGKLVTGNAITCVDGIQLILTIFGTPKEVRYVFDFIHCMPDFDPSNGKLYISKTQYDAIMGKKLIINNAKSYTIDRANKFIKRGYTDDRSRNHR